MLQSLANQVTFGDKETFMCPLNNFIEDNLPKVNQYYAEITKVEEGVHTKVEVPPEIYDASLTVIALRLLGIRGNSVHSAATGKKHKRHS